MPRSISILVSLCVVLISKVSFSTEIQIKLNHDQAQLTQDNLTVVSNLLIYPTPHAFKLYILPLLSSKTVIQTYEFFKILKPKQDLCEWLDCCKSSIVRDLKDLQTLYYINQIKPSPLNTILYSKNSKTAITLDIISPEVKPNETCALLLFNEIFPFKQYELHSEEVVWVAQNSDNFFVALKTDENNFTLVARGNLHNMNFHEDLECIWHVYNLRRFEKFLITFQYFLTILYVKYFEFVSPFLGKIFHKVKDDTWRDCRNMNINNFFDLILSRIMWVMLCYTHAALEYHIFMLPFNAVITLHAVLLNFFTLPTIIFFLFPVIPYFMDVRCGSEDYTTNIFALFIETIKNDLSGKHFLAKNSKTFLTYKIEPQNTMWILPFMVERPQKNLHLMLLTTGSIFSLYFLYSFLYYFFHFSIFHAKKWMFSQP
jgi:hypothetical protein